MRICAYILTMHSLKQCFYSRAGLSELLMLRCAPPGCNVRGRGARVMAHRGHSLVMVDIDRTVYYSGAIDRQANVVYAR